MQVLHHPESGLVPPSGTAVTIGAYDGVHRGHRAVIARVRELAAARGLQSALVTFDRHPARVVRPESAPKLLCDLPQRLELLADTGLDYTLVVHFDEVRAKEAPDDFVREVLVGALGPRAVVVGADFHFGHRRLGNVALLERMGAAHDFEVVGPGPGRGGRPAGHPPTAGRRRATQVSSTAIRLALAAGDLPAATEMLGRAHEVRGPVVRGDGRARELGFRDRQRGRARRRSACRPTGSTPGWYLRPDGVARPAAPVARPATHLLRARRHLAARGPPAGLRRRPLRRAARVRFVARLRAEEKFDSVDALVAQMGRDCDGARAVAGARLEPGDGLTRVIPVPGSVRGGGAPSTTESADETTMSAVTDTVRGLSRPGCRPCSRPGPSLLRVGQRTPGGAGASAVGACPWWWSTASPPRASSTSTPWPDWWPPASRWWPSTWPATAAPRACRCRVATWVTTPPSWAPSSKSWGSAGLWSPATPWAVGSRLSWPPSVRK